ncbi:TetR/AcrR family transcriptional regulator [Nocardioides currus]|uniref:TetR family transcriptional regulator n=1 Tax=Nocardioides currus TaxID=2133958 RepID=A0A2R7YUR8_9ACTN|nr:TetR/AcrR family transcriptional regulator [Nocardioides currus]PUA80122.1 TetR family transcriptional regulator [Nocardioides currus]
MARNEARRTDLADIAIGVLAREGSRGLTHRAVDRASGSPLGTTSNYFRTRAELVAGLADRIIERLTPVPESLAALAGAAPGPESFAAHIRDIVRRLTADPDVTIAWFELRLEAARSPEIAAVVGSVLRDGFAADIAYNATAGLPGGPSEIALFHYAVDGLVLDRLTESIDPDTPTDDVVAALVAGLLPTD